MQNTPDPVNFNHDRSPCLPAGDMDDALELAKGRQDHLRAHGDETTNHIADHYNTLRSFAGGRNV